MKIENIPADIKSKSLKEAREEINKILSKLESSDTNLEDHIKEYDRLIKLNKHVDLLFRKKVKEISLKKKKMLNKKLIKNGKLIDIFLKNYLKKQKKTNLLTPMMYGLLIWRKENQIKFNFRYGKNF